MRTTILFVAAVAVCGCKSKGIDSAEASKTEPAAVAPKPTEKPTPVETAKPAETAKPTETAKPAPLQKLACKRKHDPSADPADHDKITPLLPEVLAVGLRDAKTPEERAGYASDFMTVVDCETHHMSVGGKEEPDKWLAATSFFFPKNCTCEGITCTFELSDAEMQSVDTNTTAIVKYLQSGRVGINEIHIQCTSI